MMQRVTVPPFESFYAAHRDEVLGLLRRRLGAQAAGAPLQETFLRALHAYARLEHADHLRAWVLTIASRVAIDAHRRARPAGGEVPELAVEDGRPDWAGPREAAGG